MSSITTANARNLARVQVFTFRNENGQVFTLPLTTIEEKKWAYNKIREEKAKARDFFLKKRELEIREAELAFKKQQVENKQIIENREKRKRLQVQLDVKDKLDAAISRIVSGDKIWLPKLLRQAGLAEFVRGAENKRQIKMYASRLLRNSFIALREPNNHSKTITIKAHHMHSSFDAFDVKNGRQIRVRSLLSIGARARDIRCSIYYRPENIFAPRE